MGENKQFLSLDGLVKILAAIKEKYSAKSHTHNVTDIEDISVVGKTGKFSDLIGIPSTVGNIPVATTSTLGTVKVGKGITVNNGVISVKANKGIEEKSGVLVLKLADNCGLSITNDGELKLNLASDLRVNDSNEVSNTSSDSVYIEGSSWLDIFTDFETQLNTYATNGGFCGLNITINNTSVEDYNIGVMSFFMPYNKIKIYGAIKENIKSLASGEVNGWCIDGYTTEDELLEYEIIKILSSDDKVDAFEMYLLKKLINMTTDKSMLYQLIRNSFGKEFTEYVNVVDVNPDRFTSICNTNNPTTSRLFKYEGGTYVQLSEI